MAQTKVGEAYVEIHPRIAKDFAKKLRDDIEKQLSPLGDDIGRNIGASLGDSIGESFSERFGDHAHDAVNGLDFRGVGNGIGERLGDDVAEGFKDRAVPGVEQSGAAIQQSITYHFQQAAQSADKSGRDIDLSLRKHLSSAASGTTGLAKGFASLATSAVTASGSLAGAAGAIGVAAQGALTLTAALAPATGALATLPGLLLTLGAAQATLKTIFSGLDDAFGTALTNNVIDFQLAADLLPPTVRAVAYELHGLREEVNNLRGTVQEAFFSKLQGDVAGLNVVLPILRSEMSGVAEWFGVAAHELAVFATDVQTLSAIKLIFRDLGSILSEVVPELDILLEGFRDLGVIGASYIASLAPGLGELVNQLGWFMYHAAASGDALRWMENAGQVFKQLGAIVYDVGGIFAAVFRALDASGNNALGVIGSLVDGVHEFLDSTQGQEALTAVFSALAQIGSSLVPVVTALATAIGHLAPIIGDIAQLIGPILTTAIKALEPALATLGPALVTVFVELGNAVTILAQNGALQNIAVALASILVAIAPILPPLAQLISLLVQGLSYAITTWVAPALSQLVTWITEAVNWLSGGGLSEDTWLSRTITFIYETVAPLFQQAWEIIQQVATDLVAWFTENQSTVEEWGSKLQSIVSRLGEIIGGVFEFIAWAWDNFGGPLLNIIGNVFTGILGVVDGVLQALSGLIQFILGVITGDWERAWEGIKSFFEGIWNGVVAIFETIWKNFIEQFKAALALFDDDWEKHWDQVSKFAEDIWNGIVDWLKARVDDIGDILDWFGELPGKFGAWFNDVSGVIVAKWNEIVAKFQYYKNAILSVFDGATNWLYNIGRDIVQGLWNGVVDLWNGFINWWNSAVSGIEDIARKILDINSPSRVMREIGKGVGEGMALGIEASSALVDSAVSAMADGAVDAWGSPELSIPAWDNPSTSRLPATTTPAGDDAITNGVAGNVYQIDLHAIPTVPTERQIVDALDYADALYATT